MKKNLLNVIISVLFSGFLLIKTVTLANAASTFSEVAIGPFLGTTGVGVQVSTPLWSNYLNLTTGYSGLGFSYNATSGHQRYHANLRVGGAPVYLSAYPFGPHFHLDLGIFINSNRIDLSAVPNHAGVYIFNGHNYTKVKLGTVSGHTYFDPVTPYIGIGWGNPFFGSNKWTFTANAGVIVEGSADAELHARNENEVPEAGHDIRAAQRSFTKDVTFFNAFPVVNLGVVYRF